jgi:hypothetical protein
MLSTSNLDTPRCQVPTLKRGRASSDGRGWLGEAGCLRRLGCLVCCWLKAEIRVTHTFLQLTLSDFSTCVYTDLLDLYT